MKKLDCNDYFLRKFQGKVFKRSLLELDCSSPVFIRRFMNSSLAPALDNKTILNTSLYIDDILYSIDDEYGQTSYGKTRYGQEELYWIGYIYRVLCLCYKKSSKQIYKLFPSNEIIKYYYIYHTFDPEYAAERMMENIGYNEDYDQKGLELLKELISKEKEEVK